MKNQKGPLDFIKEITNKKVEYLMIGRRAVIAYGGPVQTMDYDIYVNNDKKNIELLLDVAKEFELRPTVPKEKIYTVFKFRLENDFIVDVFTFKYFVSSSGEKISFQEIFKRKKVARDKSGFKIFLPSIDDLIKLKKIRSSTKDLEDIKYLQEIKKRTKG